MNARQLPSPPAVDRDIPDINARKKISLTVKLLSSGVVVIALLGVLSSLLLSSFKDQTGTRPPPTGGLALAGGDFADEPAAGTQVATSGKPVDASPEAATGAVLPSPGGLPDLAASALELVGNIDPIALRDKARARQGQEDINQQDLDASKARDSDIFKRKLAPWSGSAAGKPAAAAPADNIAAAEALIDRFAPKPGEENADATLSGRLRAVETRGAEKLDLARTIPEGNVINCLNEMAIQNLLPGKIRCLVNQGVMSADSKNILIPPGAVATGEYAANSKLGDRRLFVIWQRIRNPDGQIVSIQSPGVTPDGMSGLAGELDTRFAERFGGAILVSVIADAIGSMASSGVAYPQQSTEASKSIVAQSLNGTINLPPVITIPKGQPIAIMVNRDIHIEPLP